MQEKKQLVPFWNKFKMRKEEMLGEKSKYII